MRHFNISSIEGNFRRFGIEAVEMLRAFAQVSHQAYLGLLRFVQSLLGIGTWQSTGTGTAISRTLTLATAGPALPVATLGGIAGQYLLNTPALLDAAKPSQVYLDSNPGNGRDRDFRNGQRHV